MKLSVRDLDEPLRLEVKGNEGWLKQIYADYPAVEGQPTPSLQASLHIEKEVAGTVKVRGELKYAPFIPCSRCDDAIQWPVSSSIDTRFYPRSMAEEEKPGREKTLTRGELDLYFIADDETVDLELLINDTLNMALPSQALLRSEDGKSCKVCLADLSGDLIYGSGPEALEKDKESPFAALKNLKRPN